ncbi:MAG: hypothetical protein ABW179_08645, partial [Methylobacterium sp.]
PIYHAALPRPGTPRERAEAACKAALIASARGHRRSAVLDWRRDGPEARDPALFFDQSHYRLPLAHRIATDIAAAVERLQRDPRAP